jgi:tetratricopeptide (TPR) repeat protein
MLKATIDHALWTATLQILKAPKAALEKTDEVLAIAPENADALILQSKAHRALKQFAQAENAARRALKETQAEPKALRELALIRLGQGRLAETADLFATILQSNQDDAGAWSVLADVRRATGDHEGAQDAIRRSLMAARRDPECLAPAHALNEERLPDAECMLRLRLSDFPTEVATIRMMAELATRIGRLNDAEKLLRRALEIAPYFDAARELLARNLQRANRVPDALVETKTLSNNDPDNPSVQLLLASLLVKIGDQEKARTVYERLLAKHPDQALTWMSYGHVLKTLGHQGDGVVAYRRAIKLQPTLGEAWWSLANLKTFRFSAEDVEAMEAALLQAVEDEDRLHLHFALGKACEDARNDEAACRHWRAGNAIRHKTIEYDADENHGSVQRAILFFDKNILTPARRCPAKDPIFILGMPRSGSTLVEQILASHSQVEGTMELPDMMEIAARLKADAAREGRVYPDVLSSLSDAQLCELGDEYIERTRVQRKTQRPFFIDKMPNNWAHIGLIRMILPNAKIIDARRHPAGCCLSVWKQHFARGQGFSYDLVDLARYYRDYVDLTDHFDQVMPGLVHRVIYERMVADMEAEVRRLLNYLDLSFEPSCLKFWENDRAVRTASSEQVRQPIFSDAVEHWRRFEPWIGPLLDELAPVIETYPGA